MRSKIAENSFRNFIPDDGNKTDFNTWWQQVYFFCTALSRKESNFIGENVGLRISFESSVLQNLQYDINYNNGLFSKCY